MRLLHEFAQPLVENMRINLCCRDIRMSQKLLNDTQICAILKKVRCKSMPLNVR